MFISQNFRCAECHSTCATCNGSSESQCILCKSNLFALNGKCLNKCPDGFYGDKKRKECMPCFLGCDICDSVGCLNCSQNWTKAKKGRCVLRSSNNCDECKNLKSNYSNGFYILITLMLAEYYENGQCHSCHSTCETCTGPTESDCLTCSSDLLLQSNKCINVCDEGFFVEGGMCAKCLHTCTQCVSRTNCTSCVKGLQLQSGECRGTCADG